MVRPDPITIASVLLGLGSMIFGLAIFNAFGRPDLHMRYRFVFLNGIFHIWSTMGLAPGGAA